MRTLKMTTVAIALLGLMGVSATASAQTIQLALKGGRVTLVAKDATVRQILTEWARIGETRVVNVDRIPGGPVTVELNGVTEDEALDVLLRAAAGYMTALRPVASATLSKYDRIFVLPTSSTPPRSAAVPATIRQPVLPGPNDFDQDTDPAPGAAPGRPGPVFNTFPQPQIVNPPQGPVSTGVPGVAPPAAQTPQQGAPPATGAVPGLPPGSVSVPGMVAPPPAQPGQQPGTVVPR